MSNEDIDMKGEWAKSFKDRTELTLGHLDAARDWFFKYMQARAEWKWEEERAKRDVAKEEGAE